MKATRLPDVERLLSRPSGGACEICWRMLPSHISFELLDLRNKSSRYLELVIKNYSRRFFQLLRQRVGSLGFPI